jgi:hypothetical protein
LSEVSPLSEISSKSCKTEEETRLSLLGVGVSCLVVSKRTERGRRVTGQEVK